MDVPRSARLLVVPPERLMTGGYVELHARSFYSFGEGASHVHELLAQAREYGYPALALTDTNLCGALEFARLASSLDIRPITGGALTLTDGTRLTLLARTRTGYSNISRLFTMANAADRRRPRLDPELLSDHSEGVILLTGGRDGGLSKLVTDGRLRAAGELLARYLDWYGTGSVYVELQLNLLHGDTERNRRLAMIAGEAGVPVVATNDVHYHSPERSRLHDALVAARLNTTVDQALPHLRPNHHLHLKSHAQMERLFARWPEAVSNTLHVAERCEFDLGRDLGYTLPDPAVPEGYTAQNCLRRLCHEAAARMHGGSVPQRVEQRLQEEFKLIEDLNLAGFLLLYREIALLAQRIMEERGTGKLGDAGGGETARAGARLVGGPPGRIPHRHQPRRSPEVGPHAGAFHIGGHDHSAGHRHRLPPGTEGRADRACPPALRARVCRADRHDNHLQGEGHRPGPRQGPWPTSGSTSPCSRSSSAPTTRRTSGTT